MRSGIGFQLLAVSVVALSHAPLVAAAHSPGPSEQSCEPAATELQGDQVSLFQGRKIVSRDAGLLSREEDYQPSLEDVAQARKILQSNMEGPSNLPYNFTNFEYKDYKTVMGSQWGQVNWVDQVLGGMEGLFVVESGAWDGEEMSNSIGLETLRNWNCLLVEPNPSAQQSILEKHRRCHVLKGAFSADAPLFSTNTLWMTGGLSGFNDTIGDRERAEASVNTSAMIDGDQASFSGKMVAVPTFRFDFVLSEMGVKTVDYWSLDTEGSEANILRNTDFSKVEVGLLTVEHNKDKTQKTAIHDVMAGNGFLRVASLGPDDAYVNPNYFKARNMTVPQPQPQF